MQVAAQVAALCDISCATGGFGSSGQAVQPVCLFDGWMGF